MNPRQFRRSSLMAGLTLLLACGSGSNLNGSLQGTPMPAKVMGPVISMDATPPTVSLTSPSSGSSVTGNVSVTAAATDNVGVVGVQFQVNGVNAGAEDSTAPYSVAWNSSTVSAGTHTIGAIARDAAGNRKTAAISVTVGTVVPPPSHPRMYFSAADVSSLRTKSQTTHRFIWDPIRTFAESKLNDPLPPMPGLGEFDKWRVLGDYIVINALAYVITGEQRHLDFTRARLLHYASWTYWDSNSTTLGVRDLGHAHMLRGNAIAYDWVYAGLSNADRTVIRTNLARRAQETYESAIRSDYIRAWDNWWSVSYAQNHNSICNTAMGVAALVLDGEDSRSAAWLNQAIQNQTKVRTLMEANADGTWHEGIPYQAYLWTQSLPFYENLRRLRGQDLLPHTYLQNYIYMRLYNYLPSSPRFAFSTSNFEWSWANGFSPTALLRFSANEYNNGHAEWLAQEYDRILGRPPERSRSQVYEFFRYDPGVTSAPPGDLPLSRTFPDFEGVIWRRGWGGNDLVFALKTGAQGGRAAFNRFVAQQAPWDPANPYDALNTGHDHEDANSFYLYRGGVDLSSEVADYRVYDSSYHNTLLVDGEGQAWTHSSVNPADFAGKDGRLERSVATENYNFLTADATRTYPGIQEFRRHVLYARPDYFVMVDVLRDDTAHQYEWTAHFDQSVTVEGSWIKGLAADGQILGIKMLSPAGFLNTTGDDGKAYIRIRPAANVANTQFITVLFPTISAAWSSRPAIDLLAQTTSGCALRFNRTGTEDHLFRYGGTSTIALGDYRLNGSAGSVARDTWNSLRQSFLAGGTLLSDASGARVLIQTLTQTDALEAKYVGTSLWLSGTAASGTRIYGPMVDLTRVSVNGKSVKATRDGEYVVLPGNDPR